MAAIGQILFEREPTSCTWWLDRPVSNSGRLRALIDHLAQQQQWPWHVELAMDVDRVLRQTAEIVVTADSVILDTCRHWTNLALEVVRQTCPDAWIVPMVVA